MKLSALFQNVECGCFTKTSGFKFGIFMKTTFKFHIDWVEIVRKCIFENRTNILQFAKHLRTLTIFFFSVAAFFFLGRDFKDKKAENAV